MWYEFQVTLENGFLRKYILIFIKKKKNLIAIKIILTNLRIVYNNESKNYL